MSIGGEFKVQRLRFKVHSATPTLNLELFNRQPAFAKYFLPIRLSDQHTRHDQDHRQPKRGRDRFVEKNVGPGHGADRNQVVEQIDFARFPVAQCVVPKREGNDAARQNTKEVNEHEISADNEGAVRDLAQADFNNRKGQKKDSRPPKSLRRNFRAGQMLAENAALPAVVGPKHAAAEGENFPNQTAGAEFECGPKKDDDTAQRQDSGGVTLKTFPAFLRRTFPQQRPNR